MEPRAKPCSHSIQPCYNLLELLQDQVDSSSLCSVFVALDTFWSNLDPGPYAGWVQGGAGAPPFHFNDTVEPPRKGRPPYKRCSSGSLCHSINTFLTSEKRTTFEMRTEAVSPKCPLFRGSTVFITHALQNKNFNVQCFASWLSTLELQLLTLIVLHVAVSM